MRRRRLLVVGGTALLAGCTSDSDESTDTREPSGTTTETDVPTSTATETDEPTETETSTPSDSGGTQQWSWPAAVEVRTSPVVVDGSLYFGVTDGYMYALDATDSSTQWSKGGSTDRQPVFSSPTVVDDTVYYGRTGYYYAVNANDGTEQWNFESGGQVYGTPAVSDDLVYTPSLTAPLYALNMDSGEQEWEFNNGDTFAEPSVADGTVYIGGDTQLYAVDAELGTLNRSLWTGGKVQGPPVVTNGSVYLVTTGGDLFSFNVEDGAEQWSGEIDGSAFGSLAVADETIYTTNYYFDGGNNRIFAIDANTGENIWTTSIGGNVDTQPTVANGTVYVGCHDGNVYAVDVEDGTEKWRFETGGEVHSSPAVADGSVYFGSDGGNVYSVSED